MSSRVLLVDDDVPLLRALDRNLSMSYDTTLAASAREALEILENDGPFSILISDVKMPGMDGIQLIERVHERWPHMICMLLTGNQEAEIRLRAQKSNAFRFLCKPAPHVRISEAIDDAITYGQNRAI